ncbi:MAG TPA: hypothetical protein VII68_04790 [Casimicrobiaceae bacterium]
MSESFRTICRVALVAAGLTLGSPAAFAATATLDCGTGTPTWNSSTSTLSCGAGSSKCSISGPTSAVINTQFTLNASCPSGSTYTWTGSQAAGCSGATCNITETSTGNKIYTVATETAGSVSNNYTVNITSGAVVPSGCTLSANPGSGPSGSNVTLTATCTAGTSPVTIAWGGASGTSGCPTSFNVGNNATCVVSNVTSNSTWTASFSNSAGNNANNPRSASFSVQSGGGGNFAGCPSGTITIDNPWGETAIDTAAYGEFGGNIVSVRLVAPSTMSGTKTSSWAEFGSAPTTREAVLSTVPCDFTNTNALKNGYNQYGHKYDVIGFNFQYKLGSASAFTYGLTAGTSYYINIRNKNSAGVDTCTISDCRMRGGLPQ